MIFNELEKEIDDIIIKFSDDIERVFTEVSNLISKWVIDNDITKVSALNFDIVVNDMLSRAGYFDVVNEFIDNDYDKLFPMIQSNLAITGAVFAYNAVDLENIMALKALDANKFSVLASTAGNTLRESLTKYAISDYTSLDMQRDIVKEFQGTSLVKHSKTIADTAINEFNQAVINTKAEEFDDLVWFYDGANIDSVTRDYCRCILRANNYYSKTDKLKMEHDSRRKYNCRHKFYPGTEEYAKEKGFTKSSNAKCR